MTRERLINLLWILVFSALCTGFVFLRGLPHRVFFEDPEARFERKTERLHRKIGEATGLLHLWTFDEAIPRDIVGDATLLYPGTVSTRGKFGSARKFNGDDKTFISTRTRWGLLGDEYTIALWVLIKPRTKTQDIMWGAEEGRPSGFRLADGVMCFDVPEEDGAVFTLSHPFRKYDQFVHLAVTVDGATHTATLYVDGVAVDSGTFGKHRFGVHHIAFGRAVWYRGRYPFHGVLDETAIWKRALGVSEIVRLSRSRHGIMRDLAPTKEYLQWSFDRIYRVLMNGIGRVVYFGNLDAVESPAVADSADSLPAVNFILTGEDRRHFIRAHRRSLLSGRRTDSAAAPRNMTVSSGGKVKSARLRLLGTNLDYVDSARPSYLLETEDGMGLLGSRQLALSPPESCGWLDPLVQSELNRSAGLSAVSNGLCRLSINGQFRGTYVFSDYAHFGVLPGELPGAADGLPILNRLNSSPLFHRIPWPADATIAAARLMPYTTNELLAVYDRVASRARKFMRLDSRNPISAVMRDQMLDERRATACSRWPTMPEGWSDAKKAAALLDEFYVLGDNLSPQRITQPLSLGAADKLPRGVTVKWVSGDAALLTDGGIPLRPDGGGPREVAMTAEVFDGEERVTKVLSFRIMPARISVPTLALFVNQYVNKAFRTDAAVEICAAGEDQASAFMLATQATGGGISHRGNTGYFLEKKLITLETDEPHRLFGDEDRQIVLSINALQDPSMICNSLAYNLFRSFKTPDSVHVAPRVIPAEVFVNGRYYGLVELCTRIDETLVSQETQTPLSPPSGNNGDPQWIFFRSTVVRPRVPEMAARRPELRQGDFSGIYEGITQWIDRPPTPEWVSQVPEVLDLTNLMDFQILLSLFKNRNGYPFDFQFHEVFVYSKTSRRFFYLPWDFDWGFHNEPWELLENKAQRKLRSGYPDYDQRLAERWKELRRGPLATQAVLDEMERLLKPIEGYAEWDEMRWRPDKKGRHVQQVETVRSQIQKNLVTMDDFFNGIKAGD